MLPDRNNNSGSKWNYFLPIVIAVIIWEALSFLGNNRYFPHIYSVIDFFIKSFFLDKRLASVGIGSTFTSNVWTSFVFYIPSSLLGLIIGVLASLVLFLNKTWLKVLEPVFDFFRIIPPLIIAPFLLLAFKGHSEVKLFITLLYTALSICVYGLVSLQNIPTDYIEAARLFGTKKMQLIGKILFPAMLPGIIGGIRVNIAMSLGVLMVSEFIGGYNGIGKVLKVTQNYGEVKYVLVAILWSIIIVTVFDFITTLYLRWTTKWNSNKRPDWAMRMVEFLISNLR